MAAAAVVLAAPWASASSCERSVLRACDVTYSDLGVREGQVVATVHPFCDPKPVTHLLKAVLEIQVGDLWVEFGPAVVVDRVPGPAGFDVDVRAECREGVYRVHVWVAGSGPAPDAAPYEFDATGSVTSIALVQCAG